MTSRIIFSNHGEIDPRLITLMGVNVKPASGNPIGFFGTGLKYAIAVAVRLNQRITIMSGLDEITFDRVGVKLREKDFDQIRMTTTTPTPGGGTQVSRQFLGFTTELGKQWEPWMAYREFYCNCIDENGSADESSLMPKPQAGMTHVVIEGAAFAKAHRERHTWLLESRPLVTLKAHGYVSVELHAGASQSIFYQGIKVNTWTKPSLFTWNFTSKVELSEDRQAKDTWELQRQIIHAVISSCEDKALLRKMFLAPEGTLEGGLNWNHAWNPSETVIAVVDELFDGHFAKLPPTLIELVKGKLKGRTPQAVALTKVQELTLKKAKAFLAAMGHPVTEEIIIVESLGSQWIAGLAKEGRIFLPLASFGKGTKFIASTLLEEHLHCSLGLHDCSREMQDWLFDKVLSLAEEATGEPL